MPLPNLVRSVVVFVLIGPLVGWLVMLLQLLLLSEAAVSPDGGVPAWLGLFAFGMPLSYVIGAIPALIAGAGHCYWYRKHEFRIAFAVTVAIGGLVGPVGAIVLSSFGDIGLPDALRAWHFYILPGACAAAVSAFVIHARVSRMADVGAD